MTGPALIADALEALAGAGIVYTLVALLLMRAWARRPCGRDAGALRDPPAITMLKPLHGPEPDLDAKLRGFLDQRYPGRIDMVCGVADVRDPAAAIARGAGAAVVADATRHGSNAKICNVINIAARARGDVLVLSDSDMAVPPDYAATLVHALDGPGVGAVSLVYCGRGEAGGWSRLSAAAISWSFLPSVVVGAMTGLARPCMGSTIALRRDTLDRIGGFHPFADLLADDYAVGVAVRDLGLAIAIPPLVVTHGCTEPDLATVWRHELRWMVTVRSIDPAGFAGSAITHPLGWALLGWMAGGTSWLIAGAIGARLCLAVTADRLAGHRTAPLAWLPARDLLSFVAFWASFTRHHVSWRGTRFGVDGRGRMRSPEDAPMETVAAVASDARPVRG